VAWRFNTKNNYKEKREEMIVKKSIAIVLAGLVLGSYPVGAKADDIQPSSSSSSTSISSQVQSSSAESSTSSSKGQSDQNAESTKQPEISSSSNASKSESSDTKGQNDTPDSQVTIKNGWVTDNDQTFYYENNQKVIGEKYIAGYWYLFDKLADGAMVTGLQNLAGYGQNKTVYYNDDGQMLYGEQKINGIWYLFNKWNGGMVTGFQNLAGYGQNKTVYYNDNGQMLYGKLVIKNTVYTFNNQNGALYFNPYYYAQNNILWGNVRFGNYTMAQTGCVMASLAMVITGYGNNITPLQAATFGYNHGTFNHGEPGTDQNTLVAVAKHYGLTPRGLNSKSQLQDALENGRPVVIAVQQPFIPWYGVTHEIVVSKYSSGKVYVQDPLGTTTGWHTLSSLWK